MLTIEQSTACKIQGEEIISICKLVKEKRTYFLLKRLFDTLISVFVIIFLLSWLVPLIGLLIKLDSKGPVFFIQRRIGKGLKSFGCIKFRTMSCSFDTKNLNPDESKSGITPLGQFLRKISLDELPQFINVLLGHMSIVGPRPHMFTDCQRFSILIQNYKLRSVVRPGITGLAQVKGFRGPADDTYNIFSRFYYDIEYIKNLNFQLDLKIIFLTIFQVIAIFLKSEHRKNKFKKVRSGQKKIAA